MDLLNHNHVACRPTMRGLGSASGSIQELELLAMLMEETLSQRK